MSATQDYIDKYAAEAVRQQQLYGIPASITLAQGILESANGKSQLARNENNHFGIKATQSWLASGGKYALYTDDAANETFCKYASVAESFEHHSKFLKNNSRYAACFKLSSDDYKGWANGLQKAGYATNKSYAQSLISVIERNGLAKYDKPLPSPLLKEREQTSQATQTVETLGSSISEKSYESPVLQEGVGEGSSQENDNKKSLFSSDSSHSSDPIMDMAVSMFMPLVAVAAAIDNNSEALPSRGGLGEASKINPAELASRNFDQLFNQNNQNAQNLKLS